MLESFLITSRETLEASLVVGITLAYLNKSKQKRFTSTVYLAVLAGVVASAAFAYTFSLVAGGFSGQTEMLFEGVTMLLGAALLTTMILWMASQRQVAKEIEHNLHNQFAKKLALAKAGIFLVVFIAIIREGVETVIFLNATHYASGTSLVGGLLGVVAAIILSAILFTSTRKLSLKHIFTVSSVLLLLFAAGLLSHSIEEFTEAGVIPLTTTLYDTTSTLAKDSVFGSFLRALFGYNPTPTLLEFAAYIAYLAGAGFIYLRIVRRANYKKSV